MLLLPLPLLAPARRRRPGRMGHLLPRECGPRRARRPSRASTTSAARSPSSATGAKRRSVASTKRPSHALLRLLRVRRLPLALRRSWPPSSPRLMATARSRLRRVSTAALAREAMSATPGATTRRAGMCNEFGGAPTAACAAMLRSPLFAVGSMLLPYLLRLATLRNTMAARGMAAKAVPPASCLELLLLGARWLQLPGWRQSVSA